LRRFFKGRICRFYVRVFDMKNLNLLFGTILVVGLIAADRVLKVFATDMDYSFFNGFIELVYRQNTGIAFSIPIPVWASILITASLIGFGLVFVFRNFDFGNKLAIFAIALVLAGALGNMYDRIFLGYVVDYISIWKWPVFNFADMCIFCGALIIGVKFDKITSGKK